MRFPLYIARYFLNILLACLLVPVVWLIVVVLAAVGLAARFHTRTPKMLSDVSDADVSIIIPNWNGRELLAECLPTVVADVRDTPGNHEIILVDNASTDDSVEFVRQNFPSVTVLAQDSNLGYGGGCNAGAAASRAKYVVMLNNDMKVEPGCLRTLLAGFTHPRVFAVTAQIFFWDRVRRREETGKTRGSFQHGRLAVGHEVPHEFDLPFQPVFYAGGGSSAYDRIQFLTLGGFDPIYEPFYVEDCDLSYRAWKRGWHSLLGREAIVHHKHRGTIGTQFTPNYILDTIQRNNTLFYWKNLSDVRLLAIFATIQPLFTLRDALRGRLNLRPWRLALERLRLVLNRIWNERTEESLSDWDVLELANNPKQYRERFLQPAALRPGEPLDIVFLSPYLMYPVSHGGAARMYNVVKRLASRHRVRVLSYVDIDDDASELTGELERYGVNVHTIVRRSEAHRYDRWGATPAGVREFATREFRQELAGFLQGPVDVLQVEYTQLAQYTTPSSLILTALTEHDVSFLSMYRRIGSRKTVCGKIVAWLEWLKMLNYELAYCRKFDLLLTVTETEGRFLRSYLPDCTISSAAPTGIDVQAYTLRDQRQVDPDAILFVGFLRHAPNVEAALFLAEEIFPKVQAVRPSARLTIVGAHPPPQILVLGHRPGIVVTGYVADVRDYYRTHAVLAAPIRTGAGVRVKVLEAMAAGVPVVTTTLGAEGIKYEAGRDLVIADDSESIAQALVGLLADPDRAARLAESARLVVEQHYDWDIIVKQLENLYYTGLQRKRGTPMFSPGRNVDTGPVC